MSLKPRYVFPLNFREQDKEILDAAIQLAKEQDKDLTGVMREALKEFTKLKLSKNYVKIDEFFNEGIDPIFKKMLSPQDLKGWVDSDVLYFAKTVRGRKQELEAELKRRGYYFTW